MSDTRPTVKEAQVDWLTLTFKEGGPWIRAKANALALQAAEARDGEDTTPVWFKGYTGEQCGRVGILQRDDGGLIRVSGALADEAFPHLQPLASNVSRIDLAVTLRLPPGYPNPMKEGYARGPTMVPPRGAAPDYQLIEHSRKGTTLYVGSRTSPRFGRVYDKWAESQLDFYRGCTRYELEAKSRLAARLAAVVASAPDRRSTIRAVVRDYFEPRGVTVDCDDDDPDVRVSAYRPRTSDLSRLHWLSTQVKGVADDLRARGRGADVDAALGTNAEAVPGVRLPDWWYDQFADQNGPRVNPVDK
jgi:hypothetical protein